MICFRDTTFCASLNCENKCGRKPPDDLRERAREWWGNDDAPIAWGYYCGKPESKP